MKNVAKALLGGLLLSCAAWAAPGDMAIYFGRFDPPHNGHLAVAKGALEEMQVDKVWLVPTRDTKDPRDGAAVASYATRLEMCRLVALREPGIGVLEPRLTAQAFRSGPAEGWRERLYQRLYAQLNPGALVLDVIGMDRFNFMLRNRILPRAEEPRMVLVIDRPGHELDLRMIQETKVAPGKFLFLHPPVLDISSTDLQSRLAEGESVADSVPRLVQKYLDKHQIYR